jgi:tRNA (cytosine38-C5)-methyltransferase
MQQSPEQPLKVLEFYSGVGGWHYALSASSLSGRCAVVGAFELNPNANAVYAHNFDVKPRQCNIEKLRLAELEAFDAEMWVMSPPCQPFTRLGKRKDVDDHRTDSCLSLLAKIPAMARPPRHLLLENVQGFECSETRRRLVGILASCDYTLEEFLLDPRQLGVPNSRLRYYMIATRQTDAPPSQAAAEGAAALVAGDGEGTAMDTPAVLRREPPTAGGSGGAGGGVRKLREFLEPEPEPTVPAAGAGGAAAPLDGGALLSEKVLLQSGGCVDIVLRDSAHTTCFTKAYSQYAKGTGSVLASACDSPESACALLGWTEEQHALYCAKDVYGDGHAAGSGSLEVPRDDIERLRALRLRYFSPREVANLMGFPPAPRFRFPDSVTTKQRYKLLGNSVRPADWQDSFRSRCLFIPWLSPAAVFSCISLHTNLHARVSAATRWYSQYAWDSDAAAGIDQSSDLAGGARGARHGAAAARWCRQKSGCRIVRRTRRRHLTAAAIV